MAHKRKYSWEATWYDRFGKRHTKSGFTSKKNAELYEAQQRINDERRLIGVEPICEALIEDVFDKYLKWATANKRHSAMMRDKSSLGVWQKFFQSRGISFLRQLQPKVVHDFIEWRSARKTHRHEPPSRRTINLDLVTIRHVLNWCVRFGISSTNPLTQIPLFRQDKPGVPRYLSKEEITLIEDIAKRENPVIYEIIFLLLRTGMRSGELCALRVDNIDFDRSQIILRPEQTKARYMRQIPVGDKVLGLLREMADREKNKGAGHLVFTKNRTPQDTKNVNKLFHRILRHAAKMGMDTSGVNVHTLRKTYISHMIMAGTDPVKVMAIVGHQDWSTVKRYLALSPKYLSEKTDVLPY